MRSEPRQPAHRFTECEGKGRKEMILQADLSNPVVVRVPKTCAHCGREFVAIGREYTCPGCRKPKLPKPVEESW